MSSKMVGGKQTHQKGISWEKETMDQISIIPVRGKMGYITNCSGV
jgi:hypothetical protein